MKVSENKKEYMKTYSRNYYLKNRERLLQQTKRYYLAHKAEMNASSREYYRKKCDTDPSFKPLLLERRRKRGEVKIQKDREYQKTRWDRMRREVMLFVGGEYGLQCRRCGFDEFPALQIDHVNGGGRREIQKFKAGNKYLIHIKKNPENYQILCANCNWIKKHEKKEAPYKAYKIKAALDFANS